MASPRCYTILGYAVSGSDLADSEITHRLERLGVRYCTGHQAGECGTGRCRRGVVGGDRNNVEVAAAKAARSRSSPCEMLAELMRMKYGVAVAGSHGKTTTTSLIATVLARGDPTLVIGGRLNSLGGNAKLGQGEFMVAEADESDGSFPQIESDGGGCDHY